MDLVDHHCHGVSTIDLDDAGVEAMLGEGGSGPPAGRTNFDSPVAGVRRHCAPVLDLDPHVSRRDYLTAAASWAPAELAAGSWPRPGRPGSAWTPASGRTG
jgi:hypothetical protein